MIKFFRKIRYDLMGKNKTRKYLKYAIGEIILVVIGILIALQINNWNQQRLENKNEQQALINLKVDFEFNYSKLNTIITKTKEKKELQFRVLNHTGNKPRPKTEAEFNILINALSSLTKFLPRNGSLDELLNSGKLGIIKNQNLRNRLSSWNPVFEFIKVRELSVYNEINKINEVFIKKGSWLNADAVGTSETQKNNQFPKSGFEIDNRDLLNDIEFENRTENIIYQNDMLINSQKVGLALIEEILKLVNEEIKK